MPPVRSGHEVCRAIRADPALLGTRVLMLSAKGGTDDVSRGISWDADEYMIKPFATQDLLATVRTLLSDSVPGLLVRENNET